MAKAGFNKKALCACKLDLKFKDERNKVMDLGVAFVGLELDI